MKRFAVLDTEATNTGQANPSRFGVGASVYDLGYTIADASGAVYLERRFIIRDIFMDDGKMRNAYYANKIPQYYQALADGTAQLLTMREAWQQLKTDLRTHEVRDAWAYNARFDRDALNSTVAQCSNGWVPWALPYGTKWRDIMQAFATCYAKTKRYRAFCEGLAANGYDALTKSGQPRKTAELAYRYLTKETDYDEQHTALSDAQDELTILLNCLKQKKKLPKRFN